MVRNEIPYFIWTTRRDILDCRFLSKDQMINHYARAGSFTTKVSSSERRHAAANLPALGLAVPFSVLLVSKSSQEVGKYVIQWELDTPGFKSNLCSMSGTYRHGDCK